MQTQQEEYTNNQALMDSTSDGARTANGRNEIVIHDLVKYFGDVTAVNGLSLEIRKGEFFGFLGPTDPNITI